jgi:hypothetical protein
MIKKPMLMGTCGTCNMEIFSWKSFPDGGKRFIQNSEYRDIVFVGASENPTFNGTKLRVGFCSECADKVDAEHFQLLAENRNAGIILEAETKKWKDDSAKHLYLGAMLSIKFVGFNEDKKRVRRCCQHCYQLYFMDEPHDKTCPVIQKDLA